VDIELYGEYGISISNDAVESECYSLVSLFCRVYKIEAKAGTQSKMKLPAGSSPLDESNKSKLKLGLFSYPVLQAADILVHRSVFTCPLNIVGDMIRRC
jgi:tryptophanyl-tRNA synthetase